jgi:hypothetical protein
MLWPDEFYFTTTVADNQITVSGHLNPVGGLIIPNTIEGLPVTSIGSNAFQNCTGLTSVDIPDSVTNIGSYAFQSCSGLTSVTIPDSVSSIGRDAFINCTSVNSYAVSDNNLFFSSQGGVLFDKNLYTLIQYPVGSTSVTFTIPASVVYIGPNAFYKSANLTSITIPDSVITIGSSAFRLCAGLSNITIPDSVTTIGGSAFRFCSGLKSVTIGYRVSTIMAYAFYGCTSLPGITIPNNVTSVGDYAFYGCTGLASVKFMGNAPVAGGTEIFTSSTPTVYRRQGSTGWSTTFAGRPVRLWPETAAPTITAEGLSFNITASVSQQFIVQARSNLLSGNWLPIFTGTVASADSFTYTDAEADTHPTRYYRIILP